MEPIQGTRAQQGAHRFRVGTGAFQKIDQRRKRPELPLPHNPAREGVPHIPDDRQGSPNTGTFRQKTVGVGADHIRRQDFDPQPPAFQRVGEPGIEAFPVGQDGSEELLRMVPLQDGGLICFDPIGGGVGPAKGISLKPKEQAPDLPDFLRRSAFLPSCSRELVA